MKKILKVASAIVCFYGFSTHADVLLTYELSGPEMESRSKSFAVGRFFARIDDASEPDTYLLFQAGKFFPLFSVNKSVGTYTQLNPEAEHTFKLAAAEQEAKTTGKATKDKSQTTLQLTKKTNKIAGVQCRVVEELKGDQAVMNHCMADKARLGITERETRTLARTFGMARERGLDWLGTATTDEGFVSIASQDLQSKKTLQLKSISTKPLPVGHLRVPTDFKQVPLK